MTYPGVGLAVCCLCCVNRAPLNPVDTQITVLNLRDPKAGSCIPVQVYTLGAEVMSFTPITSTICTQGQVAIQVGMSVEREISMGQRVQS